MTSTTSTNHNNLCNTNDGDINGNLQYLLHQMIGTECGISEVQHLIDILLVHEQANDAKKESLKIVILIKILIQMRHIFAINQESSS